MPSKENSYWLMESQTISYCNQTFVLGSCSNFAKKLMGEKLFSKMTNCIHVVSFPSLVYIQMIYKFPFVRETGRLLFWLIQN